MRSDLPLLSVEDLERMTPEDRRAAFELRIVRDPADLPPEVRKRINSRAVELGRQHLA